MNKRMLRKVTVLLLVIAVLMPLLNTSAARSDIRVVFEGRNVMFDVEPQIIDGRTFVQYRPIAQAANFEVNWNAQSRIITAKTGNSTVAMTVNSSTATVNGRRVTMAAPARIINGHTMVPLRFVGESLGHEVIWNDANRSITINRRIFVLREADGTRLVFDKAPQRIIALSRSVITILHALSMTPVGIHDTSLPLPDGLENVTRVGLPHNPSIERIVALSPDLVIASTRLKATVAPVFTQHNIRALFLDTFKYDDTINSIRMFGEAFDRSAEANRIISDIEERRDRVVAEIRGKRPPRVLILFGTAQAFMYATEDSYVGDLVRILNGVNVIEETNIPETMRGFVPFSVEQAVALNPEVILRISHGNPAETLRLLQAEFTNNPIWQNVNAVKNNRVYDLDSNLFDPNPGVSIIDALEDLAEILYP